MSDTAVADLLAKQAITEALYRYCRGLDRMDRPMASRTWHPDGTAEYVGMFKGTGEGFLDWVWPQHASMYRHSHQISNILIEVDGDRAASEAYVTVALRIHAADQVTDIRSKGRYCDRWSCRDGVWAVDDRVFVEDFNTVVTSPLVETSQGTPASRRDTSDPSYTQFAGS